VGAIRKMVKAPDDQVRLDPLADTCPRGLRGAKLESFQDDTRLAKLVRSQERFSAYGRTHSSVLWSLPPYTHCT